MQDQIMTIKELSVYLQLAQSTIYRLAGEGRIPAMKIGGRWRFSKHQIDQWIALKSQNKEQQA